MKSNTQVTRPNWLTDSRVSEMRQEIKECNNPYTDAELADIEYDSDFSDSGLDLKRLRAYHAIETLKKYNLL